MSYNRDAAVAYAHKWAMSRNTKYYDFSRLGGDCTNFVSQCIYEGSKVMNYTPTLGWYYRSVNDRTPSWSGVAYLYNFLIANKGAGPHGTLRPIEDAVPGDVIQLSFDGLTFKHSLFVVKGGGIDDIRIATHTYDADEKPLWEYVYKLHRLIHIE